MSDSSGSGSRGSVSSISIKSIKSTEAWKLVQESISVSLIPVDNKLHFPIWYKNQFQTFLSTLNKYYVRIVMSAPTNLSTLSDLVMRDI